MFWKTAVNKDITKLKGKNLIRIKIGIVHRICDSFPKTFTPAIFKSKYMHEVIKTLNIEAPAVKVLWEITVPARFVKIRGRSSIVEFDSSKVVGQKSGAVINMDLFRNVFFRIFGFQYAWYVKTAAGADNISINLYMVRCKQCFQFAAIYSICFGSRIQYNDSFQFERTWSCWMYCLNQPISSALFPVFFKVLLTRFTLGHFLGIFPHVHSYSTNRDSIYSFLMF